ncbi:MAG TPA: DNA translocase FtsK [Candidatus Saccharimonadales bacterium]|nr:DNA translocase FtsK [Candidatus Saccharimonadales bacterium]
MMVLSRLFVPTQSKRLNELIGILLLATAVLMTLALASYSPLDRSLNTAANPPFGRPAHNWIGLVGAYSADLILQSLGVMAFLLPVMLVFLAVRWMRSRTVENPLVTATGAIALLAFASALLALLPWPVRWMHAVPIEGLVGRLLGDLLVHYLNYAGAYIVAFTAIAAALYLATAFSLSSLRLWMQTRFTFFYAMRDRLREWKERRTKARELKLLEKKQRMREKQDEVAEQKARLSPSAAKSRTAEPPIMSAPLTASAQAQPAVQSTFGDNEVQPTYPPPRGSERGLSGIDRMEAEARGEQHPPDRETQPLAFTEIGPSESIAIGVRADVARTQTRTTMPKQQGAWKLPSSTLLHRPEARQAYDEQELKELALTLTQKCGEFGVLGTVVQINPGPVVTTFEFKPEAGIKYSRIVGLQDDLCLAMRAESILIERVAGKSTVGIQVPNEKRETIWLREVVESPEFSASKSKLTIALGKDINGRLMTTEMNSMPHLLIAGSTGSGKSVAINAFIMALLYKSTPEQVRLILVDPKRVELTNYDGVPHLYTPIISEPKLASNALRNAVREMERRLKLLAQKGVRNIDQYNRLFEEGYTPSLFEDGSEEKPLPYIVIIVDELADLMMVDGANVEESITRLAQMARAIGIHLILATQRPSVDVITGLIKANFPARMSFRVATKIDSRTILDANGAESLLGRGDMLYLPSGSSRVLRVHAPFVTEKEIAATVEFWKAQATAQYEHGFLAAPKEEGNSAMEDGGLDGEAGDNDPMYNDAVRLVFEFGKASTSLLQRRLRVGYGRAAHLIDLMERDGIVGPADGPKPREILKPPDWISEMDQ